MYQMAAQPYAAPPVVPGVAVEYAGFRRRFFARMLDAIILSPVTVVVSLALDRILGTHFDSYSSYVELAIANGIRILASLAIGFLYFTLTTASKHQATPGKRAFGIYVTDAGGGRVTMDRSAARVLANYLTDLTFLIGYIMQRFTRRRQALHDKLAGTLVLRGHYATDVPAVDWMRNRNQLPADAGRNAGWVTGTLICVPLLMLICGGIWFGVAVNVLRFVSDRVDGNARQAIAEVVEQQVGSIVDSTPRTQTTFYLDGVALDINTAVPIVPGNYGVEHVNDQAFIYGFETHIDQEGIAVQTDHLMYQGMPFVLDGEIRFDEVARGGIIDRFMLSPESIGRGLEDGINNALASFGLVATNVSIADGRLVIDTMIDPAGSTTGRVAPVKWAGLKPEA